jgi:oligopeptide/dipeptide ABC transporter ATP-binding protein
MLAGPDIEGREPGVTALLSVRDLTVDYRATGMLWRRRPLRAVDGVSLTVARGETLALVGESGSGKSTVARAILRLQRVTAGMVEFDGHPVLQLDRRTLRGLRRRMQIVLQDPSSALNPRMRVGAAVAEGLEIHRLGTPSERGARVAQLLTEVGLDPALTAVYPHQLSGGQRQRVVIARALAVDPELLVLDEPVSALDVSVQAQVLSLILELQQRRQLAYLLVAHDLAVVRQVAHRIAVMYLGRIVETGPTDAVLTAPAHPYTRMLLAAAPDPDPRAPAPAAPVTPDEGSSAARPTGGCLFQPRCPHPGRDLRCLHERPLLRPLGATMAACHHAETTSP